MKNEIRKQMIEKRDFHHTKKGHLQCISIMDMFLHLPEYNDAKCILVYAAKGSEVHTQGIIRSSISLEKKVVLPAVKEGAHELELYWIKSVTELTLGAFRIPEPPKLAERKVEPDEIDLVVVPGISFDRRGYRIGYGHGYYDRLLPNIKGKMVGLTYKELLLEKVPEEPHDIAVDIVVTEDEVIDCRKEREKGAPGGADGQ